MYMKNSFQHFFLYEQVLFDTVFFYFLSFCLASFKAFFNSSQYEKIVNRRRKRIKKNTRDKLIKNCEM